MAMEKFRAAPLPNPTIEYDAETQRQLIRVLEVYFNQLDSQTPLQAEYFKGRGDKLTFPTALYYSTQDQTYAAINTAYPVTYNNTYYNNDMSLVDSSKITVDRAGIYNFQFTCQLVSSNSSSKNVHIWIRKNGTDVTYSSRAYTISGVGTEVTAQWTFNIDLQAQQYIQIMTATDDTTVTMNYETPSAPYPGTSSAVISVNHVSDLEGITVAATP
jgi:hypothetical protein